MQYLPIIPVVYYSLLYFYQFYDLLVELLITQQYLLFRNSSFLLKLPQLPYFCGLFCLILKSIRSVHHIKQFVTLNFYFRLRLRSNGLIFILCLTPQSILLIFKLDLNIMRFSLEFILCVRTFIVFILYKRKFFMICLIQNRLLNEIFFDLDVDGSEPSIMKSTLYERSEIVLFFPQAMKIWLILLLEHSPILNFSFFIQFKKITLVE